MENRLTTGVERRARPALGALVVIMTITATWWALALWPVDDAAAPEWLTLTRAVCFGAAGDGLPNAGGWLILIGQPLGMLIVLFAAWGADVRVGISRLSERVGGQLAIGGVLALLVLGAAGVFTRVRNAGAQPFAASPTEMTGRSLTRINDAPSRLSLVDQSGAVIELEQFRGRPVLVTFAYAHCETVCPLLVHDVLSAARAVRHRNPVVLIVTLDPWRDTPGRLGSMARQWGATRDAHILSGNPEAVDRVLNAWRVPRVRNIRKGDLVHPSVVYVIGPTGRISYVLDGGEERIRSALLDL